MGAPLGIPMAADGPRTRSSAKLELGNSDYLDNDGEENQSLSSVSPRKGRKSCRKRSRVSRKRVKQELTEDTAAAAAAVTSMNGTIPAGPALPVYTTYPPEPQPLLPEAPNSALARLGPPGLPAMGHGLEPGILPFAEAVGPSAPSFAVQQGTCMQGTSWMPLPRKDEDIEMQGGPTGAPEGPPTEAEVKALVACLIRRPVRALKLAPCLMEEVERVWWLAKQQQQQEGEQLQPHHGLKGPAQAEDAQQPLDANTKQDLAANTLEAMNCGVPTDPAEAPPPPTAATPAAPACDPLGFASAEAYREEPAVAGAAASVASSRSTAPLCTPASSDCGMPFQPLQPLQQHEFQQQQLEQQQLRLHDMQEQQQLHPQQQECHGAPSLSFDEPPILQLDSSPNLAVTVEGGPQGPPPAPPGPPHLGWLDG